MIEVGCQSCGSRYRAPDHAAGKSLRCKKCGQAVKVPAAAADTGLEIDPSMLELAMQKEAPRARAAKPAAPPLDDEEAKFAALLNQIDAGESIETGPLPPAPRQTRAERKAAQQRAKQARAAQASSGNGSDTAYVAPADMGRSNERYGRDDVSKLLFLLFALATIGFWVFQVAQTYNAYNALIKKYNVSPADAPGFPLGKMLLMFLISAAVFLFIAVPYNIIGVWITAKIMKLRLMGSAYLNTLGWMSVPTVFGMVGLLLGGQGGFAIAYLVGLLLTAPAFGYLHGLRIVETIVGYLMTIAVGVAGAAVVAVIAIGVFGAALGLSKAADQFGSSSSRSSTATASSPDTDHTNSPSSTTNRTPRTTPRTVDPTPEPLSPFEQTLKDVADGYGSSRTAALTVLAHREPSDDERSAVSRALNQALSASLFTRDQVTALQAAIHWDIDTLDAHLIKALGSYDKTIWLMAAQELAKRKNPAAVPTLLEKLRGEPEVAELIKSYGSEAEPAVRQALAGTSFDSARVPLVNLLAEVGTAESVEAITPLADSSSVELAEAARAAWRKLSPDTYDPVALALSDLQSSSTSRQALGLATLADAEPNDTQRRQVTAVVLDYADGYRGDADNETLAKVLEAWKDPITVRQLKAWLDEDASTYERRTAIDVLSRWQEPGTLPLIQRWVLKETDVTVAALIRYGQEAEAPMVGLLDNRNEEVAAAACRVLAEVGTKRCLSRLRTVAEGQRLSAAAEAAAAMAAIQLREGQ